MNRIVITLVFLLLCISFISKAEEGPKSQLGKIMANEFSHALDLYFVDCHEFPSDLQQLVMKPASCKFWGPDPYLKRIVKDPWGNPWRYRRLDSVHYELMSLGADGKEGGVGDNLDLLLIGKAPLLNK